VGLKDESVWDQLFSVVFNADVVLVVDVEDLRV
jgi:hypothetical protein